MIDSSDRLWVASYNGLFVLKGKKIIKSYEGPEFEVKNDKLYKTREGEFDTKYITCFQLDGKKCLVGTNKALYIINIEDLSIEREILSEQINSIKKIGNLIFLCRNDGLYLLKDHNYIKKASSLRSFFLKFDNIPLKDFVYNRKFMQMWISECNGGIYRIKKSKVDELFSGMTIFSLGQFMNKIIISSEGNLLIYNGYSWKRIHTYPLGNMPFKKVFCMYELNGNILMGTEKGLYIYDGFVFKKIKLSDTDDLLILIRSIAISKKNIYLGTQKQGLIKLRREDVDI